MQLFFWPGFILEIAPLVNTKYTLKMLTGNKEMDINFNILWSVILLQSSSHTRPKNSSFLPSRLLEFCNITRNPNVYWDVSFRTYVFVKYKANNVSWNLFYWKMGHIYLWYLLFHVVSTWVNFDIVILKLLFLYRWRNVMQLFSIIIIFERLIIY